MPKKISKFSSPFQIRSFLCPDPRLILPQESKEKVTLSSAGTLSKNPLHPPRPKLIAYTLGNLILVSAGVHESPPPLSAAPGPLPPPSWSPRTREGSSAHTLVVVGGHLDGGGAARRGEVGWVAAGGRSRRPELISDWLRVGKCWSFSAEGLL